MADASIKYLYFDGPEPEPINKVKGHAAAYAAGKATGKARSQPIVVNVKYKVWSSGFSIKKNIVDHSIFSDKKVAWRDPDELCNFADQDLNSLKYFFLWLAEAKISKAQQWARAAYKEVKRIRLYQPKEWEQVLPKQIVDWAWAEFKKETDGVHFCDNFRVALWRNTSQKRRYNRQKDHGCCGFSDEYRRGPDGQMYMLGFNYGH